MVSNMSDKMRLLEVCRVVATKGDEAGYFIFADRGRGIGACVLACLLILDRDWYLFGAELACT